ncbi:hypothetical protein [Pallidibacillus pasinlerensis]|uniref:Phospholipid phosphatase n=1 Tax=Pallidibacillus pasinlerensis TaxID=2703818 RepID=A0ABX0A1V0_9BACI|nr:hypothetical protein [Pallidibacillus pasinlerensis]NCU17382.1 hypothetical protein [Pallidibacillus pasinlerensis]
MNLILTLALFVAFIFLLIQGIILANKYGWFKLENTPLLVILALVYEMFVLFIGRWVGEGGLLEGLNYVRFWLHALVTPLLILFSWKSLYRASFHWVKTAWLKMVVILLTIALICYELVTGVLGIKLEPKWEAEILFYENATEQKFPLMISVIFAVIVITGFLLWRKQRWPWLLMGVSVMLIGSLTTNWLNLSMFMNVFEWILLFSLLCTKKFQDQLHNI